MEAHELFKALSDYRDENGEDLFWGLIAPFGSVEQDNTGQWVIYTGYSGRPKRGIVQEEVAE